MSQRKDGLTHLDAEGRARMVDVTEKSITRRQAVAEGRLVMSADIFWRSSLFSCSIARNRSSCSCARFALYSRCEYTGDVRVQRLPTEDFFPFL